jgi:hypothetical protein
MNTFVFQQNKFIFIFAGLMLAAGAAYFAYRLLDTAFLAEAEGFGKVVGKEYVPSSEKYQMQNVGGINRTVKIAVPETWLVDLEISGDPGGSARPEAARASVDPVEFRTLKEGDVLAVKYRKRRISGNVQVTQVSGRIGG